MHGFIAQLLQGSNYRSESILQTKNNNNKKQECCEI